MNPLIRQSIIDNVHAFCDKLSDKELQEVVSYFVYEVNMKDRPEPNEIQLRFIDEFFSLKDWNYHLEDVDNAKYLLRSSATLRTNLDFIQKVLLSDAFFRFMNLVGKSIPPAKPKREPKPKPTLTPTEKKLLTGILQDHEAMLEYQLEDEESIAKYSDDEVDLVALKKEQLNFLQNFSLKVL